MSDSLYKLADEAYRDVYGASVDDTELRDVMLKVANAVCQIALTLDAMIEVKAKSQREPQDDKPAPDVLGRVLELANQEIENYRILENNSVNSGSYSNAQAWSAGASALVSFCGVLKKEFNRE